MILAAVLFLVQAPMPRLDTTPSDLAVLRYIDITQGNGAPAEPGKRFTVHYTGWLKDGTKFDSSVDRNEPFTFVQGRKQVITGWEIGFEGMKAGGKRRLFIPYQLAYGEKGTGPIPARAELIFDVELLDVKDAPTLPAGIDLLLPFADLEQRVLALAKAIPADQYSWQPSADAPSFAAIFLQIANRAAAEEVKVEGKDKIVDRLTTSLAAVHKQLESARNGFLSSDAEVMGKPSTQRGTFAVLNTAIAEQLGQAEAYARQNRISF